MPWSNEVYTSYSHRFMFHYADDGTDQSVEEAMTAAEKAEDEFYQLLNSGQFRTIDADDVEVDNPEEDSDSHCIIFRFETSNKISRHDIGLILNAVTHCSSYGCNEECYH